MSKIEFEKLLLEAVDEGLSSLGESSKQAIYFHLDKSFKIKKHQIPKKVDSFEEALERIFGSGADFIETMIVQRLTEKVEQEPRNAPCQLKLKEYIARTQQSSTRKDENIVELKPCVQVSLE